MQNLDTTSLVFLSCNEYEDSSQSMIVNQQPLSFLVPTFPQIGPLEITVGNFQIYQAKLRRHAPLKAVSGFISHYCQPSRITTSHLDARASLA